MLLEMNKTKAKRMVEIASTFVLQKTHKNNWAGEDDITYASAAWMNSIDPKYATSGRFQKFIEIIDHNYSTGRKTAKMCRILPFTYEIVEEARNLPRGYFVDNKDKETMMKDYGSHYSAAVLRKDILDVLDHAINKPQCYKLSADDALYLDLMKLWIDKDGTLFSHYRQAGERKTYYTPSLQQASKKLRDFLLENTGYCDVDAKSSFNYDFSMLLAKYGWDELSFDEYFTLETYFGRNSRKFVMTKGITKQEHLAMMFGSVEAKEKINKLEHLSTVFPLHHLMFASVEAKAKINEDDVLLDGARQKINKNFGATKFDEIRAALEKFTLLLAYKPENQNLQGWEIPFIWSYKDYGRCLARILNRIETKKMEVYSKQLDLMGYKTIQFCYDGLILDKELTKEDLEEVNDWFMDNEWESPLEVKKVWK